VSLIGFKAVHVEREDRQAPLRAKRAGDGVAEPIHEQRAVGEPVSWSVVA
jgi:hypothetical protein